MSSASQAQINRGLPAPAILAELGAPALVMILLVMLVLPLPPFLLDLFFTFNIALSLVVLLSGVYANRPLDFASFPAVLLIATLLRLGLNIASTRVVLLNGHEGPSAAGQVIAVFGDFVVGGNYAVGLVVFAILVIINFVVVTKGAGRISEVTARFTLDAMPGKQMAIDADLNAGLISAEQATLRREEISKEADFYGAMDGASKFVRGDAVAGILILFINIIGGLAIGVWQHDLGFEQAAHNYVLLTIGDGLVAQIPSLLLSTATAIIITRVSDSHDLGEQMADHLFSNPRTLLVTGGILGAMGLIPGMPLLVFLPLSLLMIYLGYQRTIATPEVVSPEAKDDLAERPEPTELSWDDVDTVDQIGLEVGYRLIGMVDKNQGGELLSRIKGVRKKLSHELGFLVQPVHVRDNLNLGSNSYRISFHGVTMGEGEVYANQELAIDPGNVSEKMDGIATKDPTFSLPAVWVDSDKKDIAQTRGYTVVDASTVVATHLSQLVKNNAHELIGQDETQALLDRLAKAFPKLVENLVPKTLGLVEIAQVLRNLLEEGVPVRDMRTIAEALAEVAPTSKDPDLLTSQARRALKNTIFQSINGSSDELNVMVLDSRLEQTLQQVVKSAGGGIEPRLLENMTQQIGEGARQIESTGSSPVMLVSQEIRQFLSRLMRGRLDNFYILAYEEIPLSKRIKITRRIGEAPGLGQAQPEGVNS